VGAPDGSEMLLERETGEDPRRVGDSVARKLRQRGAEEILRQLQPQPAALPQP
jgi:porphobilinogen deaminase